MRSSNINSSRIRWEFEEQPGVWTAITASVSLESNCTDAGAVVKLVPEGLLPPAANMRAVVAPEFRDIVSEQNLLVQISSVAAADPSAYCSSQAFAHDSQVPEVRPPD
jgi:hypothetical protein